MNAPSAPSLSIEALRVLDGMPFDPDARSHFDVMSGGLQWTDEFPRVGSAEWPVVRRDWSYRFLIGYRASLTLGERRDELRPIWEQVVRGAPNWPGLRPERHGRRALGRLRAALRLQDRCLTDLESELA